MEITEIDGGWKFAYEEAEVVIDCRHLHRDRYQQLRAEITIFANGNEYTPFVSQTVNLSDVKKLEPLSASLEKWQGAGDKDWFNILIAWRVKCFELERNSLEVVEIEISPGIEHKPLEYLVKPLLPKGLPTIMFGDKNAGKSTLAKVIALLVRTGQSKLGFEVGEEPINVLYHDYETNKDVFQLECDRIGNGMNLYTTIHYSEGALPVATVIEKLKGEIAEKKIDLLIIDSLAYACGGNLNESEGALRFWGALGELNCTKLILAHPSKEQQDGKQKSIYGSVFFATQARSIWRMENKQEEDADEMDCCLTHTNSNLSKKFPQMFFGVTFDIDATTIERKAVEDTLFADRVPMWKQIKEVLVINGGIPMSEEELATALGMEKSDTVRRTLYRHKQVFTRVSRERNSKWGLVTLNNG